MATSLAAISTTGSQLTSPMTARAARTPRTRHLSASGSRNAPERVVPCRRARTPSRPSEDEQTNQSPTSSQLEGPVAMTSATISGDASNRAIVMPFVVS